MEVTPCHGPTVKSLVSNRFKTTTPVQCTLSNKDVPLQTYTAVMIMYYRQHLLCFSSPCNTWPFLLSYSTHFSIVLRARKHPTFVPSPLFTL